MPYDLEYEIARGRATLNALAYELASVKAEFAARRFLAELKKYNPNQPRAPRGSPIGGQWVDAGGGNSGARQGRAPPVAGAPKIRPPKTIARNAPLGAASSTARAVGLPLATGAVGIGRAAGTFEHFTTGRQVTPILKIPFDNTPAPKPQSAVSALSGGAGAGGEWQNGYADDDECEESRDDDIRACQINAATYGRNAQERKELFAICHSVAMTRYSECRAAGSIAGIKTQRFEGRFRGLR